MTITSLTDKEVAYLVGDDQRAQLIVQINMLAFRINQASLADVTITQSATSLGIVVHAYYRNEPVIKDALSLGGPATEQVSNLLFVARLRSVAKRLQEILDAGGRPLGAA